MLTFLKTRPELRQVQLTNEQTIAARFVDGPGFVFLNNLDTKGAISKAAISRAPLAASRAADSLPAPGGVILLNGLGVLPKGESGLLNQTLNSLYATAHLNQLVPMFQQRGYQPATSFATLSAFRTGIKSASVLYFIGHGGVGIGPNGASINIINSSEAYDPNNTDATLKQDIAANYVGYAMIGDIDQNFKPVVKAAYYITPAFITNYMSFTKNSLVFINGCVGIVPAAHLDIIDPKFDAAFFSPSTQASAYMGWDGLVNAGDVRDSAEYFFDRLLGANVSNVGGVKATPPNIPYNASVVLNAMQTTTRSNQPFLFSQSVDSEPNDLNRASNLRLVANPKDQTTFGLLAPSISLLSAQDAQLVLTINGDFGPEPGSVTMAGVALNIRQWSAGQILCDLPKTGGGDVVVTVKGISSPPHRLLEWLLPVHYQGAPTGAGDSHTESADFIFQFRGDFTPGRSAINAPPGSGGIIEFEDGQGSTGSFTTGGQYEGDIPGGDHHKIVYTGSGTIPIVKPQTLSDTYFQYNGSVDFGQKTITLFFDAVAPNAAQDTIGVPPNTTSEQLPFHLVLFTPKGQLLLHFDDQGVIQADTVTATASPAAGIAGMPPVTQTFRWNQTAPTPGSEPNPNQSRSASAASSASYR